MDGKQWPRDGGPLICGIVLLCLQLTACSSEEAATEPVIRPVRYQEVVSTGARQARKFSGTARAGVESDLSFRIAGTLQSVSVVVGDKVRKGREIARLDPTDARLQVQEAEAALAQARASERKAVADYDRIRGLYENKNAAKSDLDAARAQAESTAAQVESVRRRLDLARRQLSYTRLLAPVAGAIASVPVEVNENVSSGQPVAILTSGSRPEVEVAMPGVLISQISEGAAVEVTFDALPGTTFPAVITEVGVAATAVGATFPVTVQLTATDSTVRPGLSATVTFRFESGDGREHIYVPSVSVGEDREGRFVFVLDAGDGEPPAGGIVTAKRRSIEIGDLTQDGIEVLDGLVDGELVVTAGVRRIENGQQVKMLPND
ncbi:MAG: efflux RND transporter periplasmic adaptor subunit [Thermoanaerobaculia bacterium]